MPAFPPRVYEKARTGFAGHSESFVTWRHSTGSGLSGGANGQRNHSRAPSLNASRCAAEKRPSSFASSQRLNAARQSAALGWLL